MRRLGAAILGLLLLTSAGCSMVFPLAVSAADPSRGRDRREPAEALLAMRPETTVTLKLEGRRSTMTGLYLGPIDGATDSSGVALTPDFTMGDGSAVVRLRTEWDVKEIPLDRVQWVRRETGWIGVGVALAVGVAIDAYIISKLSGAFSID